MTELLERELTVAGKAGDDREGRDRHLEGLARGDLSRPDHGERRPHGRDRGGHLLHVLRPRRDPEGPRREGEGRDGGQPGHAPADADRRPARHVVAGHEDDAAKDGEARHPADPGVHRARRGFRRPPLRLQGERRHVRPDARPTSSRRSRRCSPSASSTSSPAAARSSSPELAPTGHGKAPSPGLFGSRPVSRILSRVTIHLCGYPAPRRAASTEPVRLAPDGVWRAGRVATAAGGLLPHRFTLTGDVSGESVAGGLFSVPLSVGFRRLPAVDQTRWERPALRCPDFPRVAERPAVTRPACRMLPGRRRCPSSRAGRVRTRDSAPTGRRGARTRRRPGTRARRRAAARSSSCSSVRCSGATRVIASGTPPRPCRGSAT